MGGLLIGLAVAGLAASAVSTGYSYYVSQQQARQAELNAQQQQAIEQQKAAEEMERGAQEAAAQRKVDRHSLAAMEARYAKAGVGLAGSPTTVMEDQAITNEYNLRNRIRFSTTLASRYMDRGDLASAMGSQQASAYKAQGVGSLLSGAASIASGALSIYGATGELKTPKDATPAFVGPPAPAVKPQF